VARRESLLSYLVVGPFAIVLAFPFYWMLMTSFKTNGDLYNVQNVPFVFNKAEATPTERLPLKDHEWLPLGVENVTTSNYEFIFRDTKYVDWLENTALIGLIVVLNDNGMSIAPNVAASVCGYDGRVPTLRALIDWSALLRDAPIFSTPV
jgi:ABC-type glycerol-3-phosphate transport system permease component